MFMPGLAFDQHRNRLGHGKGYYDRYIARIHAWCLEHDQRPPLFGVFS